MHKKIDAEQSLKYYHDRVDKKERNRKRRAFYAKNQFILNAQRKRYAAQNREKLRLQAKKWRIANPDKVRESNRKNREKHIDAHKAAEAKWREENRETRNQKQNDRYWATKADERIYALVYDDKDKLRVVYGNPMSKNKLGQFRAIDGTIYRSFKTVPELTGDDRERFVDQYNAKNGTNYSFEQIARKTRFCCDCGRVLLNGAKTKLCTECAKKRQKAYHDAHKDIICERAKKVRKR